MLRLALVCIFFIDVFVLFVKNYKIYKNKDVNNRQLNRIVATGASSHIFVLFFFFGLYKKKYYNRNVYKKQLNMYIAKEVLLQACGPTTYRAPAPIILYIFSFLNCFFSTTITFARHSWRKNME